MTFWQATTGWMGESYVRMYVWAENQNEARALVELKIKNKQEEKHKDKIAIVPLFHSSDHPFCTDPSDTGFLVNGIEFIQPLK